MGWNAGYTIYETTVVAVYNSGSLTPDLLKALIEPYQYTDIDHGGCQDLTTHDGLSADEVVVKMLAPAFWAEYEKHRDAWYHHTHGDNTPRETLKYGYRFHDEWRRIVIDGIYK